MYNKVVLVGNLTRDVEIRYSQGGSAIGKVGIATNRKFKSQTGETKDEIMFIDLTFFGRTAEVANQYLRKGSKVLVDGRLVLEQWTAQDGSKRSKHSITVENLQMLDNKSDNPNSNYNNGYGNQTDIQNNYESDSYGGYNNSYNAPQQGYGQSSGYAQPSQQKAPQRPTPPSVPEIDIDEDEIPF